MEHGLAYGNVVFINLLGCVSTNNVLMDETTVGVEHKRKKSSPSKFKVRFLCQM